ncbi:hypothetical protein ILYODFUR_033578 [Ilyodon furcidens]|uniref:Uncharacterized protein n=1 Tax=Ilyodon furcidens TaxID=33524 RepID=A0ABV0UL64_9TELE
MNGKFRAQSLLSIPLTHFYAAHRPLIYSTINSDVAVCQVIWICIALFPLDGAAHKNASQDDVPGRACHFNQTRCYAFPVAGTNCEVQVENARENPRKPQSPPRHAVMFSFCNLQPNEDIKEVL